MVSRLTFGSIAPCGVICDLCLGYQRQKNRCVGCYNIGNKPFHCTVCSIRKCAEKGENEDLLCNECDKFPCRRIKDLDKRYTKKYGESPIQNLNGIKEIGLANFIAIEEVKWKCDVCGQMLCVHRELCLICGSRNKNFPQNF